MPENKYHLRFTPKAADDLDAIYDYVFNSLSATIAAEDLMVHIEKAAQQLMLFPLSGSYVREESLKAKGYRKVVIDNYLLFYVVDEAAKQVVVRRILFGASRYQDVL